MHNAASWDLWSVGAGEQLNVPDLPGLVLCSFVKRLPSLVKWALDKYRGFVRA